MHQKLKRLMTKRNGIILAILIALGLVTGVTIHYVDKNESNDVEINLVENEENSSSNFGEQETNEVIEEKPQETDEVDSETQDDEKENGANANQVITISRPQFSYLNKPLTENTIQSSTITPPQVSNGEGTSNSSPTLKPEQKPEQTPDQGITSVDLSLTLFLSEYQILDNDVVQVKIGNEQSFNAETSEKGFLKLQLPYNSTTHLTHSLVESTITVNVNGEVSVENIKGESIIGFMERSESGEVKYRENITTFPTEFIDNIELLDLESGQFIYNGTLELKPDEILVIPAFGEYVSGVAIKIINVNVQNSKTIASIIQPELKEVYRSIDIEVEPRLEDALITLGEGVELQENARLHISETDTFSTKIKLFKKKGVEVSGSFSTSIKNDLKVKIDFDWFDTDVKEIKYELTMEQKLEFEAEYKSIPEIELSFGIMEFIIPTPIAGISIDIPVDFVIEPTGTLSSTVSFTDEFNFGIQYTKRNGLKTLTDSDEMFTSDVDYQLAKLSGGVDAGLTVSANVAAYTIDLLGLELGAGVKIEATAEVGGGSDGINACISYDTGVYGAINPRSELIDDLEDIAKFEKYISLGSDEFGICGQIPELEVLPKNIVMVPGEEVHLMLMSGNEEVTFDAEYESKDPSKLSVDSDGVLTAKEAGAGHTVIVTASYKNNGQVKEVNIPVVIKDLTEKGILKGKIIDAVSEQPVNNAKITLYTESGSYINKYYTDGSGYYRLILEPGFYLVSIEKAGYLKETGRVTIAVGGTTTYEPTLNLISELDSGDGSIKGKITHAINDYPISQVKLDIYKGFNSDSGELITTIYTDELGEYTTVLPAGNYTANVSKEGFVTSTMNILSIGDKIKVQPTLSLSPDGLGLNDLRIVLNWGSSPSDLDSHLIGKTRPESNSYFHVYYSSKNYSGENQSAMLDRDDTSSYGPETITLTNLNSEGHYVYAIHDYSNKGNMQNQNLGLSGATVHVYSGSHLLSSFSVPEDEVGNVWKVFEVINGEIVPLNEMTSTNNYHNYQSYLPNRLSSSLAIEPLSQEILLLDEKKPILGETDEEVTKPEESETDGEVTKPEESETDGEVTKPEESETDEEVTKPEESETDEEVTKPEESEPGEEVTKPEESETDEEVTKPEESETDEEVIKPEESEPDEEVTKPEEVEVSIEEIISKDIEIKLIEADIKK